jgi:hypothetical protein
MDASTIIAGAADEFSSLFAAIPPVPALVATSMAVGWHFPLFLARQSCFAGSP